MITCLPFHTFLLQKLIHHSIGFLFRRCRTVQYMVYTLQYCTLHNTSLLRWGRLRRRGSAAPKKKKELPATLDNFFQRSVHRKEQIFKRDNSVRFLLLNILQSVLRAMCTFEYCTDTGTRPKLRRVLYLSCNSKLLVTL